MNELIPRDQESLEQQIIKESDSRRLKEIISLFNVNMQKKQLVRANKLNNLQDLVCEQIQKRIEEHPGEFSNKDLLDYFKVIQETITKSDSEIDIESIPIQINQNQLNINMQDTLSPESKEKVVDALKSIFAKYSKENIEEDEGK